MNPKVFSLWLALIGATRIDLLGSVGPLVMTPFLVIAPIIVMSFLWRSWTKGESIPMAAGASGFLLVITLLMGILVLSTFASYDLATSARRVALLVVQVYLVLAVGFSLLSVPGSRSMLYRGAKWGLILVLMFNGLQLFSWLAEPAWLSNGFLDLQPGLYFGVIPRLTGLSSDPNLGGFGTVVFTWIIWTYGPEDRSQVGWVSLGTLAVLLTLSRSAVLAGLVCVAWHIFSGRYFLVTRFRILVLICGVSALLLPYALSPWGSDFLDGIATMLGTRLTLEEGSSSQHTQLILLGLEVATENLKHLAIGIGYGNAFLETQSIFPGNQYGNFHSLLVTMFAESGLLAAALVVVLFIGAYQRNPQTRSIVVATFIFNIFQQSHTEPITWLILGMGWTSWQTDRSLSGLWDKTVSESSIDMNTLEASAK
ncbi:MAG TPA: hypothetical protein DCS75_03930 [Gemmatimonadetes bacterium]|nr:hypothetical protein [Gemmatimonadota bacterium]HAT37617.1 hypothetical protein [Gemmatimonadota bacterium]HBV06327.1 hypothetical protein [Gemmatimonadota bacterium]|tara:strand:- start:10844 stop:12118 length:1275 start_codon:yes stop_codon:yes gene_type:complete